jgi:hypothetical protein
VPVTLTIDFLETPLNVVKNHHNKYFPSACLTIVSTFELANDQVNDQSTLQVLVSFTIPFLEIPLVVEKSHHTNILPSSSLYNALTVLSKNVPLNNQSNNDHFSVNQVTVIVTQLDQLFTHSSCVHSASHVQDGMTVHILLATVAVHTTAHQVQCVNTIIDQLIFHVPAIQGYAEL